MAIAQRVVLAALLSAAALGAQAQPMTDQERRDAIGKLHWEKGGTHKLADSSSTLVLPDDHVMLNGADAERFEALIGNGGITKIEAVTVDRAQEQIIFQSIREGYVGVDDWADVDAKQMLDQVTEKTEQANSVRVKNGFAEMHLSGWLKEPTLDRDSNTVYWAFALDEGQKKIVNTKALRLGRDGFELMTWVGDAANYKASGGDLAVVLSAYNFDPGHRYADHTSGDKIAAYSIAGLVATIAGVKFAKLAAAGGLLLLFKKFGVIIVAALAGVAVKAKSFFARKKGGNAA